MQVNIHEAKTRLSKLIQAAVNGEEVIIAKAGKPVVKLTKVPARRKPILGAGVGRITIIDPNWDKPMTDAEAKEFLGL
jgi:prevent-host-death family protein